MPVVYDANGNPMIIPSQKTNALPPEAPTTLQASNQPQVTQQQAQPQASTSGSPLSQAGGGSTLSSAIQSLMQLYAMRQQNQGAAMPNLAGGFSGGGGATVGDYMAGNAAAPAAQDLGTLSSAGGGSGMSAAGKMSLASGLLDMASQVGKPLQDYAANANWRNIPSAIPDPTQFIQQEQRAMQQYDFQRNPIV